MNPEIKIDLRRDLIEFSRNRLIAMGYSKESIELIESERHDDIEFALICVYSNALRRIVTAIPRKIHKAETFSVPQEHAVALNTIEQKIRNGEWIVPYLHRKITLPDYDDLLLNDWGIHHLHLGTEVCADGFVNRTGQLLYVCFRDTIDFYGSGDIDAYFIGVMDHHTFTAQTLIQIMYDNWPHILQPVKIGGKLYGDRPTDEDIRALRKGHVMYCLEMNDGTALFPPGGGLTTAGTAAIDTQRAVHLLNWAKHQQDQVLRLMPGIIERSANNPQNRRFCKTIDLRLEQLKGVGWILRDINSGYVHPLVSP